jgi:hypothetical protein
MERVYCDLPNKLPHVTWSHMTTLKGTVHIQIFLTNFHKVYTCDLMPCDYTKNRRSLLPPSQQVYTCDLVSHDLTQMDHKLWLQPKSKWSPNQNWSPNCYWSPNCKHHVNILLTNNNTQTIDNYHHTLINYQQTTKHPNYTMLNNTTYYQYTNGAQIVIGAQIAMEPKSQLEPKL